MKLTRPARNTQSETIIALIDVVFFLLVFFMLIGRMDATAPFDVDPPVAVSGQDMPAGGETLSVSRAGEVALNGVAIGTDAIAESLAAALSRDPMLRLRINAHRDADLRHVLPLIGLTETLGIRDVVLVVTPSRDSAP
ncbi:ExbD/TolR family protein [Sedimentitalea arenosa]|uniref:Biopolymer transporter ExbD n=1 Tax=Sedimentitalea arenosa TaxID=2798803 RepID=A0A8J7LWR8_9RHOB|nr:biopolymer transporter ExbD [Arenibacterium arenosum]MBJ6372525.1 biopolymer transporter ExbD [Arenibacterium arenosum]